eukprot:362581-Chlamydomonas_euryale.AAC.1
MPPPSHQTGRTGLPSPGVAPAAPSPVFQTAPTAAGRPGRGCCRGDDAPPGMARHRNVVDAATGLWLLA